MFWPVPTAIATDAVAQLRGQQGPAGSKDEAVLVWGCRAQWM